MVKVLHTVQYPESQFIPHFIELPFAYSEPEAAAELQAWGLSSKIFLCGENDAIFAMFDSLTTRMTSTSTVAPVMTLTPICCYAL